MKITFQNNLVTCQEVIYPWLTVTVLEYFHESNPTALRLSGIRETMWGACKEAEKKQTHGNVFHRGKV